MKLLETVLSAYSQTWTGLCRCSGNCLRFQIVHQPSLASFREGYIEGEVGEPEVSCRDKSLRIFSRVTSSTRLSLDSCQGLASTNKTIAGHCQCTDMKCFVMLSRASWFVPEKRTAVTSNRMPCVIIQQGLYWWVKRNFLDLPNGYDHLYDEVVKIVAIIIRV